MRKYVALFLCVIIFSSTIYNPVQVKASSVAVVTGAYVTGEAVFSLLCNLFLATGVFITIDDCLDLKNLFAEDEDSAQTVLRECYKDLVDYMLNVEDMIDINEYSTAFETLLKYEDYDEAVTALTTLINDNHAKGLDICGNPITTDLANTQTMFTDAESGVSLVTDGLYTALENDINNVKESINAYNNMLETTTDGTGYTFFDNVGYEPVIAFLNSEWGKDLRDVDYPWCITQSANGAYSLYRYVEFYDTDDYGVALRCKKNASNCITLSSSGALDYSNRRSGYHIVANIYGWRNIVAWGNLDLIGCDAYGIPAESVTTEYPVDLTQSTAGVIDLKNPYNEKDKVAENKPVYIPPINDVFDRLITGFPDGITTNEDLSEYIDNTTSTMEEEAEKDIATDITDELDITNFNPSAMTTSGLSTKFPFCIPFDLINAISMLGADAEAPYIEIPIVNERLGINEKIVIDFSDFEEVAVVCRITFTVGFVISLILITRKQIKG